MLRSIFFFMQILVLDEVTSSLDAASERYISDTLRRLPATKLIIAHRLSTVRGADAIAVVSGGGVVELGTHDQLLALEGGVYRRLVRSSELGPTSQTRGREPSSGNGEPTGAEAEAVPA
jgi:ABC-type multidrug transport system fused ATPase/permease subunit